MLKRSADNLALMSTILTCATRTQTWQTLGTAGVATQEEIQMMRIDDAFFIACNHDGHKSVSPFLEAFKVRDLESFIDCVKWTNFIIGAPAEEFLKWKSDLHRKSAYSEQESNTLAQFPFPAPIPKLASAVENYIIQVCVGKEKPPPLPITGQRDWMTGVFQQLLGVYSNKKKLYKSDYPVSPEGSNFGSVKPNGAPVLTRAVTLVTDGSDAHAELKLLSTLAKMVVDGVVKSGQRVYLGGLKAACKKCDEWITKYSNWLYYHRTITLHLPANDQRPSASPGVWQNPAAAGSVKEASDVKANIAALFQ